MIYNKPEVVSAGAAAANIQSTQPKPLGSAWDAIPMLHNATSSAYEADE